MTIITASDFRTSQRMWIDRLMAGEKIVVRSRQHGSFQLSAKPVKEKKAKAPKPETKALSWEEMKKGIEADPLRSLDYLGMLVRNTGKTSEQLVAEQLKEKYG